MKQTVPTAKPLVVLREEFDDWAILFNPETGDALGINPVGAAIWKLTDGSRSMDDIVKEIGKQFDDVPENAGAEIAEFVAQLTDLGFMENT